MSIRLHCPNVGFAHFVTATVMESAVPLLRPGDHVAFRQTEGRTDLGELRISEQLYPVGNVRFLADPGDPHYTVIECELADELAQDEE